MSDDLTPPHWGADDDTDDLELARLRVLADDLARALDRLLEPNQRAPIYSPPLYGNYAVNADRGFRVIPLSQEYADPEQAARAARAALAAYRAERG